MELISKDNITLIIHNSSRIFTKNPSNQKRIYLIEVLGSQYFLDVQTWKLFFMFRVRRKVLVMDRFDLINNKKGGFLSFNKTENLARISQELDNEINQDVKKIALKEISFYLSCIKVEPEVSMNILVSLFKDFKIERDIFRLIFLTNQQYNKARLDYDLHLSIEKKIDLTKDLKTYSDNKKLYNTFILVAPFIYNDKSIFEILKLNKYLRRKLKKKIIKIFFVHNPETNYHNYKSLSNALYEAIDDSYYVIFFLIVEIEN